MDSPHKDEGHDRRREEALARRVGEALDQLARRDAAECPDAEIIAAYHEKSLAADENAKWEGHFATCARCRKVLQVLAASVEAPLDEKEVARLGRLVAVAGSPVVRDTKAVDRAPVIRLDWRRRWLAPALGIAAVLAIWFATRAPWRTGDQRSTSVLVAQAPQNEPGHPMERRGEQSRAVAPQNKTEADAEALKEMPAKELPPETATVDSLAKKSLDDGARAREIAPNSNALENTLRDEKKQKADTVGGVGAGSGGGLGSGTGGAVGGIPGAPTPAARAAAAPAAAPPPISGPQAQSWTDSSNQPAPSSQAAPSANQTITVTGEAPVVQTTNGTLGGALNESKVKDLPVNGRNYQAMARFDAPGEFPVLLKAPSEKVVWRAGNGGNIQRSADAGGTWTAETSPLHEDWLAGAPVSDTVCWIVGRNG